MMDMAKISKKKNLFGPGTLGCHEALHMACFLASAVGTELTEHAAIKANPKWQKLAMDAETALADLYQAIGAAHLNDGKNHP